MPITTTLTHNDFVNLVCGRPAPDNNPYTKYTGNQWNADGEWQWNADWEWDRSKLGELSESELYFLYFGKLP